MKKQRFWKSIRQVDGSVKFNVARGYIIDLTTDYGYTIRIALEYKRPYWFAYLYASGLAYLPSQRDYKSKDELLNDLKLVDFEGFVKRNRSLEHVIQMLSDSKN